MSFSVNEFVIASTIHGESPVQKKTLKQLVVSLQWPILSLKKLTMALMALFNIDSLTLGIKHSYHSRDIFGIDNVLLQTIGIYTQTVRRVTSLPQIGLSNPISWSPGEVGSYPTEVGGGNCSILTRHYTSPYPALVYSIFYTIISDVILIQAASHIQWE